MRRSWSDRGAAILELAVVLPLVTALLVGAFELSQTFIAANEVEGAVHQAARMGAAAGSRVEADRDILIALRTALPAEALANADRVVVFRAAGPGAQVPGTCTKAPGSPSEVGAPECNTYTGATLRGTTATSLVGFGGTVVAKDRYWAPATRKERLTDPPDYLGVWVRTTHDTTIGTAWDATTLTRSAVVRIQPDLDG